MNFDQVMYNNLLQAAYTLLQQNVANLGQEFARGFMDDFTLNNSNPASMSNAQAFFNYVAQATRQTNNNDTIQSNEQLFQFVGGFIQTVFQRWQQSRQSQQGGFGGGFRPQSQTMGFTGGSNFGGGSVFTQGRNMNFGNRRPEPSAHLADDVPETRSASAPPPPTMQPATVAAGPMSFASSKTTAYVDNPLDDLPQTGIEFVNLQSNTSWGGDKPKDNRIVLGQRIDLKTRDSRFTIYAAIGYHQEILNDPMQVARDFFAITPDSVLGSVFYYTLNYNHLDVLDVPTADFIDVRNKCIEAVSSDSGVLLHKKLIDELKTMQYGPYKALTQYLVGHINRALFLACRLSTNPELFIAIEEFEDLNDLLSSAFRHPITVHPDGRHRLETIVGNAILNAMVKNVGVMFEDDDNILTHAIQSSPVFPYSMEGVYPNKYSIPTSQDSDKPRFMEKLKEKELSRRTYLLSRRRVVVTNMLGKNILPNITDKPKLMATAVAPIFAITRSLLRFDDPAQTQLNNKASVMPYVLEDYPSDQFQEYQDDPQMALEKEVEKYSRIPPIELPLDQTIFAVQYGVNPMKYLEAVDVFTTVDDQKGQNVVIMAKKDVPMLSVTE